MKLKKALIGSLLIVAMSVIIANFMGKETAVLIGNLGYVPITISLTSLTAIMVIKFRRNNIQGNAWIMFLACSISWMIAEHVWNVEELMLHENPFPSTADIFYTAGYVFLILFSLYYMKIAKDAITKKMIIISVFSSIVILLPSLYLTASENSDVPYIAFLISLAYPVFDAIVLIPSLLGIMMFFRGEVSRMWTFFSLAILSLAAGDTGFLLTEMNGSYYAGHPVEILLMWSYVLFSFGVYSQYQTFSSKKSLFDNKSDLR